MTDNARRLAAAVLLLALSACDPPREVTPEECQELRRKLNEVRERLGLPPSDINCAERREPSERPDRSH